MNSGIRYCICLGLLWLCLPMWSQSPLLFNYDIKTGLPSNTVYYVMQDSNGFLWYGTDSGVSRYDGNEIVTFTPQDGLSDNEILQIKEDSQNRIWFLPFNGRISYFKDGVFYNGTTNPTLKSLYVKDIYSCFFEDSQQRIWLGSRISGIKILKPDNETVHIDFLPGTIYQVWEDEDKIMILTSEGLFEFDPVDLNCYVKTMSIDFKAKSIDVSRKLHVDTLHNTIYCPLLKGLYRINYEKKIVKRIFENTVIEGFLQISPEEKWVYYDKGAFRWRGGQTAPIKGDILSEAMVSYMIRDQNGGYWFSTHNKGVFYTPSLDLKYYTKEDGLPQKNIKEIVNNKQGDVWAIQKEGEYSVIDTHGGIKTFHTSNSTICDVKVEDDTSWIAHSEGFLNIKSPNKTIFFETAVKSVSMRRDTMWISTGIGGLRVWTPNNKLKIYNCVQIYEGRTFGVFAEKNSPRVWVGTRDGLVLFENGKPRNLSSLHPYLENRISQIKQDKQGNIWMVVDATALVIIKPDLSVLAVIDKEMGFENEKCKRIFIDDENKIWFITNHSLYQVTLENDVLQLKTILSLLSTYILNDVLVDKEKIWLASTSGVLVAPKYFEQDQQIKSYLTDIFLNTEKIYLSGDRKITVPHDKNNLKINFTGLTFSSQNPYYRYKINEKDTVWSYTKSNELEFPSLPPGTYDFELQARNSDWTWNQQAAGFQLIIQKPAWKEWWFVTLVTVFLLILLTSIIYLIYRENLRKIILKEQLLESELKALTAQMNPHFVFNTLNTIQRFFLTKDIKIANKILTQFSKLIRTTLDSTSRSFVLIEDEINFLNNYLEIEQARFNEKFSFEVTADKEIDQSMTLIPSMVLQPFIENSIIHGIAKMPGTGKIVVSFTKVSDRIKVVIDDNGVGRNATTSLKAHASLGTQLIRKRLSLMNKKNKAAYKMRIIDKSGETTGTRVEIYF